MATNIQHRLQKAVTELDPPLWLVVPFLTVAISDILITYIALYHIGGQLYERNDIAVAAMDYFGASGLLLPYLLGVTIWITLSLIHPWRNLAFRIIGIFYLTFAIVVVANNIRLVYPYVM